MTERESVRAISNMISDYRNIHSVGDISVHVEKWAGQFSDAVRGRLLKELVHILDKTYLPETRVRQFLSGLIYNQKLTNGDPASFWRGVSFLEIQKAGASQSDMLQLFSEELNKTLGFEVKACGGKDSDVYVYLDDAIFTGNRVRRDIEEWVNNFAPLSAHVHIIVMAIHSGHYYNKGELEKAIKKSGKNIKLTYSRSLELENRKTFSARSDVLWPKTIPSEKAVQEYVGEMQYFPSLREGENVGDLGIFSTGDGRDLIEQEFLKAGAEIRAQCPGLPDSHRPLGHIGLETLGFGSLVITFRNCPNNAPLALWASNPWYPLFPRTTNPQTELRKMFSAGG